MPFYEEDLDPFFEDFGEDATWNTTTFKVVFHNEYEAAVLFTGEIETRNPYVEVKDSDISGIVHGNVLTIDGTAYKVTGIQPDGTGITVLLLSKD